ncbi:hypothetical protein, conserved [Entamoeba dispar SAW760]|uniref:Leucine rich repeat containing protein BspA family protein n=1 Tax=Entamoeba dispar (strain ATCC PRA-260 / SAW760) TaxID=370354 RepID=B0E5F0_ENTDS|nr:uncharacterized protein EDI_284090 [Entamoeba dispar SAW760]EDR30242.1 hypothetical protein, conserved [Entamoeba dispar SAW760]|eukprot:EDR30242.1 hypothetical protein, conserved [Entamoeba dispar SAW760]
MGFNSLECFQLKLICGNIHKEEVIKKLVFVSKKCALAVATLRFNPIRKTEIFNGLQVQRLYSVEDVIDPRVKEIEVLCDVSYGAMESVKAMVIKKWGEENKKKEQINVRFNRIVLTPEDAKKINEDEEGIKIPIEVNTISDGCLRLFTGKEKMIIGNSMEAESIMMLVDVGVKKIHIIGEWKGILDERAMGIVIGNIKKWKFNCKDAEEWKTKTINEVGMTGLNKIYIKDGVNYIEENAFHLQTNLMEIELPKSVVFIGQGALPENLISLEFSQSLVVERAALWVSEKVNKCHGKCEEIIFTKEDKRRWIEMNKGNKCISIPSQISFIGKDCFKGNKELTEIHFDKEIHCFEEGCFEGNQMSLCLKNVEFIDKIAFKNASIKSISLNQKCSIELSAFENACIDEIIMSSDQVMLLIPKLLRAQKINKILFNNLNSSSLTNKEFKEQVCYRIGEMIRRGGIKCTNVVLEQDDLIEYAEHHPFDCDMTKELNVTYIEFKKVTLPYSINALGRRVFSDCCSLTSIEFHSKMVSMEKRCLEHCVSLKSLVIPSSVTNIENKCFAQCSQLSKIVLPPLKVLPKGLFYNCGFKEFDVPKGVSAIGNDCFAECYSLTKVNLPDGIISIGKHAFENCIKLKSVNIPSTIKEFGKGCFVNCSLAVNTLYVPEEAWTKKEKF